MKIPLGKIYIFLNQCMLLDRVIWFCRSIHLLVSSLLSWLNSLDEPSFVYNIHRWHICQCQPSFHPRCFGCGLQIYIITSPLPGCHIIYFSHSPKALSGIFVFVQQIQKKKWIRFERWPSITSGDFQLYRNFMENNRIDLMVKKEEGRWENPCVNANRMNESEERAYKNCYSPKRTRCSINVNSRQKIYFM